MIENSRTTSGDAAEGEVFEDTTLAAARRDARRRMLKAGLLALPVVMTLKARPVFGQGNDMSGHSGASRSNR
jgi:hypothetical protein